MTFEDYIKSANVMPDKLGDLIAILRRKGDLPDVKIWHDLLLYLHRSGLEDNHYLAAKLLWYRYEKAVADDRIRLREEKRAAKAAAKAEREKLSVERKANREVAREAARLLKTERAANRQPAQPKVFVNLALPVSLSDRIDAAAGFGNRSSFIRDAVKERLERMEAAT